MFYIYLFIYLSTYLQFIEGLNSGRDKKRHHNRHHQNEKGQRVDDKGQVVDNDDDDVNNNNKDRDNGDGDDEDDDDDDDSTDYPLLEFIGHTRAVYGVSQFNYNAHLNSYSHSNHHDNHHDNHNDDDSSSSSYVTDDRLILSCSADETIRLWDTAVSQCVGRYNCVCPSWDVSFNPLGYYFASANQDKTATMYATDRITPIRMFVGHYSDVNCVNWHPNGMLLGTGKLQLWYDDDD